MCLIRCPPLFAPLTHFILQSSVFSFTIWPPASPTAVRHFRHWWGSSWAWRDWPAKTKLYSLSSVFPPKGALYFWLLWDTPKDTGNYKNKASWWVQIDAGPFSEVEMWRWARTGLRKGWGKKWEFKKRLWNGCTVKALKILCSLGM